MTYGFSLGPSVFKAHGHGNDYLVFSEGPGWVVTPRAVQLLCHRHRGVGADGIVALLQPIPRDPSPGSGDGKGEVFPFRLRMFNPDGSEFERSGNGLRILGAFLFSRGWVEVGRPFPVEVGGDGVVMEILGEGRGGILQVAVEMGEVRFGPEAVGSAPDLFGEGTTLRSPEGRHLSLYPVSVGNPHCVVFVEELREAEFLRLGPFLVDHEAFPQGTNVQLARVLDSGQVEIRIWERGVGRTASSGTSACAVAAAAVHTGRVARGRIRVRMEGGSFHVTVSNEWGVRLEGPVEPVLDGRLETGFMDALKEEADGS